MGNLSETNRINFIGSVMSMNSPRSTEALVFFGNKAIGFERLDIRLDDFLKTHKTTIILITKKNISF